MKFSATGTDSNTCCCGRLPFLQRCLCPQVRPRPSRGFPELSTPIWTDMVVGQVVLLTCQAVSLTSTYLKRRPWHGNPHLLAQENNHTCRNPHAPELHSNLIFPTPSILLPRAILNFLESLFFNIIPRALFSFPIQSHSSELDQTFHFRISQNCNSDSESDSWSPRMKGSNVLQKFRREK